MPNDYKSIKINHDDKIFIHGKQVNFSLNGLNEDNQSIAYILQNDGNVSTSWVDGDTRIELVAKKDIVYIEYTPFGAKDTKSSLDLL